MPKQKYNRRISGGRINYIKERALELESHKKSLESLAASIERNCDLKLELMKLRGY